MIRKGTKAKLGHQNHETVGSAMGPLGAVVRVQDVKPAIKFYEKLGFHLDGAMPRSDGKLVVAFLRYEKSLLLLGRLDELHYDNAARLRQVQEGPRGLGVVLTLQVHDLQQIYRAIKRTPSRIMLEPVDEFYGERVFMFLDPYGYEWKISQTINVVDPDDVAETIAAT